MTTIRTTLFREKRYRIGYKRQRSHLSIYNNADQVIHQMNSSETRPGILKLSAPVVTLIQLQVPRRSFPARIGHRNFRIKMIKQIYISIYQSRLWQSISLLAAHPLLLNQPNRLSQTGVVWSEDRIRPHSDLQSIHSIVFMLHPKYVPSAANHAVYDVGSADIFP